MVKELRSIDDLTPDRGNANLGTARGHYMIEDSVRRLGAGRSALVDAEGNIIAGNKTVEVAELLGIPIKIVQSDGEALVVVQRTDLLLNDENDNRARLLAYLDNRASEVGLSWDALQVASDLESGVELDRMFFSEELTTLFETAGLPEFVDDNMPDDLPDPGLVGGGDQAQRVIVTFQNSEERTQFLDYFGLEDKGNAVIYKWGEMNGE